jgi:hypothetical protein
VCQIEGDSWPPQFCAPVAVFRVSRHASKACEVFTSHGGTTFW